MAIWLGNDFGVLISSGFYSDDNNNSYYYDSNYNGFFPITLNNNTNTYVYSGNTFAVINIPGGTNLTEISAADSEISSVFTTIINGRKNQYNSNSTNILSNQTQNISSFVQNSINSALGSNGIANAVADVASTLIHPDLNFAFNDILSSWPNGSTIIQSLSNMMNNHQSNIQSISDSTARIADFKKKLVNQQVAIANEIRNTQGVSSTLISSNAFTHLSNAFPDSIGKITNILNNSNNILSNQLASILPTSGLNVGSAIASIISGLFSGSNNIKPTIVNPIDKIIVDIGKLQNPANSNSLFANFPITGFSNFLSQQSFTNQASNLLNNLASKIPSVSNLIPANPIVNVNIINSSIQNFVNTSLNKNSANSPSLIQRASTSLQNLMNINGPVPQVSKKVNALTGSNVMIPIDPFHGGSFGNLSIIQGVTNNESDPTITNAVASINQSPDPSIATSQNTQNILQNNANQSTTNQTFVRGACFNNLDDVPLRPRSTPVDGSTGDYSSIKGINV